MTVDGTTTNFAYDAWGRMTSRTRGSLNANYAWQYGSFLSQVTSNFPGEAPQLDYVYDGLQNRRLKLVDSTDYTWTRYDANGAALADYDYGASYWEIGGRERSFHGSAEIAGSSPLTGTPSYYLRNHLGSTAATTNANKNVVASYQYTPYGEFLSESTTGDHATFGYTGHRLDRELDHYYAKYRYYNPSTMRWLKRDPLGMVDGPNNYMYVKGNVVQSIDLLGLWSAGFPGLVLAGMGLGCLTGAVSGATSCLGAPRKECVSKILCGCVGGGVSGAIESILGGKLGNRILESIGINPLSSLSGSVGGFVSCVCDTVSSKGTKALRDKDTFKCCTGAALGGGISGLGLGTAARARGNQHSFEYGQLAGAVGSSVGGITGGVPGKFACCGLDSFL